MRCLFMLLMCAACTGTIESPGSSSVSTQTTTREGWQIPAQPGPCTAFAPSEIRLLTNLEIDRTLASVFGAGTTLGAALPAEDRVQNFTVNAAREVSQLWVDTMDQGSGALAASVAPAINAQLGCSPSETEEACVRRTLTTLSTSLYRRPVASSEVDDLFGVYSAGRAGDSITAGLTLAIQAMVGAPSFTYRTELGTVDGAGRLLAPWEVAAALSYNLTGAPPDATLQALVASGAIMDGATREAQVDRLVQSTAGRAYLGQFANECFGLEDVTVLARDPALFPQLTSAARMSIGQETATFVSAVMSGPTPTAKELVSADYTYADDALAGFYGLSDTPGATLSKVSLAQTPRRGLLTQAAFLMTYSHEDQTSPIKRGVAIRSSVLCMPPPPPPPNVIAAAGTTGMNTTTRALFEAHVSNPTCASCHNLIDPPGFALEGFDPIGQVRTQENGFPVDTTGSLVQSGDADGPLLGAADMTGLLAQSQQAADCVLRQVMTFQLGRVPDPTVDACTVDAVRYRGLTARGSTAEAMRALAGSDSFVRRGPQ